MTLNRALRTTVWLAAVLVVASCSDSPTGTFNGRELPDDLSCSIPESEIFVGQFRDGIPALTDPEMEPFGGPSTAAFAQEDRVVGLVVGGQAIAIPLNIFWWHEIVNLNMNGASLAITHCPLTGSSLVFDRTPQGGVEFGVSGLLYRNNLIMYDRNGGTESLWPQMARGGRCGPQDGTALEMVSAAEMTLGGWRRLHANTLVVTTNTGFDRDYEREFYPYIDYDEPDNDRLLFTITEPIDRRHPPKERAIGIPSATGGLAFAYETLRAVGNLAAIHEEVNGESFVLFWDEGREGAVAFRPSVNGEDLSFEVVDDGFVDVQTGSSWSMAGIATSGPLAGSALEPVHEAFVAFWFAWPLFYPDIESWRP